MRPGQNKRMRGRPNNNRRGPNPLTRSYESNGPDVKICGNAHHVAEKYLQLARDAHTGGDPVAAENYLQHAEHYFRLSPRPRLRRRWPRAVSSGRRAMARSRTTTTMISAARPIGSPRPRNAPGTKTSRMRFRRSRTWRPMLRNLMSKGSPSKPTARVRATVAGSPIARIGRTGRAIAFPTAGPVRIARSANDRTAIGTTGRICDGRPRDFRPYRESAPPPPREGGSEAPGPAALPPFITGGNRPGPAEGASRPGQELSLSRRRSTRRTRTRPSTTGTLRGPLSGSRPPPPSPVSLRLQGWSGRRRHTEPEPRR